MISKFPAHGTGCSDSYNFLDSQRPTVILSENEIHARADQTNWMVFQNAQFTATKMKVKVRKRQDCTTTFRRAIARVDDITVRCNHSTSHVNETWARRKALKSRQRTNFMNLHALTLHQRQYFGKIQDFQKSDLMEPDAWDCITFLFRNVQPWYFQKMKFKHRRTQRSSNVFRIHHLRSRKSWSNFETVWIVRPPFVEQLPL